jgi:ATP-binding cassette subfamily B multidrug efflux pump
MTLLASIRGFVGRPWRSCVLAGAMLCGVALLAVRLPRRVGQVIGALAAEPMSARMLARDRPMLVGAGAVICLLRAG